jgi:hypothetical protein
MYKIGTIMPNENDHLLEPRVAKLETGLELLTRDVTNLAQIVREQSRNIEGELHKLGMAVTAAAGPQKTDWATLISFAFLIMAIGSAVFWPLNQRTEDKRGILSNLEEKFADHVKMNNHPVGEALVNRLEMESNTHKIQDEKTFSDLETKMRDENKLINQITQKQIEGIQSQQASINERTYARILKLEALNLDQDNFDKQELMMWRHKAMGLKEGQIFPAQNASKAATFPDAVTDPKH